MALKDYERAYREAYAIWESFRRFGFPADDIFVGHGYVVNFGHDQLFVELRSGERRFVVVAGVVPASTEKVLSRWQKFSEEVNQASKFELQKLWKRTRLGKDEQQFQGLADALLRKGFELKALQN